MSRYKKNPAPSAETREEAMQIARGTQRPGQTKEQTKLIAQGIQKGIDQYKKKQKAKTRELDKMLKAANAKLAGDGQRAPEKQIVYKQHWLPWVLLTLSWVGAVFYFLFLSAQSS